MRGKGLKRSRSKSRRRGCDLIYTVMRERESIFFFRFLKDEMSGFRKQKRIAMKMRKLPSRGKSEWESIQGLGRHTVTEQQTKIANSFLFPHLPLLLSSILKTTHIYAIKLTTIIVAHLNCQFCNKNIKLLFSSLNFTWNSFFVLKLWKVRFLSLNFENIHFYTWI